MSEERDANSLALPQAPDVGSDALCESGDPAQQVQSAFHLHADTLYRFAMAECRDAELARDAVQESFLRLFRHLSGGKRVRHLRPWLVRVVLNVLRDEARRSLREAQVIGQLQASQDQMAAAEPSDLEDRIRQLLSARERQCIELRVLGYRYEEIADALGIRCGTVACLLSRAMRKLESVRRAQP